MQSKLSRYFFTVRYLKPEQFFFQVWYRIRPGFLSVKRRQSGIDLKRLAFDQFSLIESSNKITGEKSFSFLNLSKVFEGKINWEFNEYGKLWNYNLQYFDYLFDNSVSHDKLVSVIEDYSEFILAHPGKMEPYPVSLRIVNWLLFYSKTGYTSERMKNALAQQVSFLKNNIEYHIQANHLFENWVSLFIASLYIGDKQLSRKAAKGIIKELDIQILKDGGHIEGSPMYHCIFVSRLLIVYRLLYKNEIDHPIKRTLTAALSSMLGWLNAFLYPNKTYPFFNDSTSGIAVIPMALLEAARESQFEYHSTSLKESGYRKLENQYFSVRINVGQIKPAFQPGHTHSDMLNFSLFAEGKEIVTDPGVSTYEKNHQRALERSTKFHNTVTISDNNQSDVWGGFRVGKRANLSIERDDDFFIDAHHDGYVDQGCIHQRSFLLDGQSFQIKDKIICSKTQQKPATARLYLDARVVKLADDQYVLDNKIKLIIQGYDSVTIDEISLPSGFNIFRSSKVITIIFYHSLMTKFSIV